MPAAVLGGRTEALIGAGEKEDEAGAGAIDARERLTCYMLLYGDAVLRTARFYLRDKQRAEDAYQETFLRVYRALGRMEETGELKPWILKIAIRVCLDMKKSAWWRRVLLIGRAGQEPGDGGGAAKRSISAEGGALQAERSRELYERVTRLGEPYRTAVLLYYYHELSTEEIGRMLQVAEGTVRSRLHRARQTLRHALEQEGERG